MELGAHEPGVVRQLHDLYQMAVGGETRQEHALFLQLRPEAVVELVAVAVALGDLRGAVQRPAAAPLRQDAGVFAQAHGAALFRDVHLVRHQVDDRVPGGLGKFRGGRVVIAQYMPRELNDRHLHAQADAEVGDVVLPGIAAGADHALDAPVAEAAGHQDAGTARQMLLHIAGGQVLGVHPFDLHDGVIGRSGVIQRLHHREVRVMELGVLTHQGDADLLVGVLLPLDHGAPLPQVRLVGDKAQLAAHHLVQALPGHQQRHLVEGLRSGVLDHAVRLDVAEQGDLPPDILRDRLVTAADQNVRLDAQGQQFLDGVLGGLGLQLAGAGDLHDQRHMDEQHVAHRPLRRHLADGLQEGLGLDIAHRAADLGDDHVHILALHGIDAAFDLVGDVGDDLDRCAQIVAPALAVQHGPVYLAGGDGAVAGQVLIHEALIVAQVQVRLRAVVSDEHLAVLIGAHGAGVHIDIGVEFLVPHPDAPLLQKPPQGRRADALAQARDHAAGDKYEFR